MPKQLKHQAHGKVETYKPTTLDQLLGDDGNSKYNTLAEDKYLSKLNEMDKADLQRECIRVGLVPVDNRGTMVKRLQSQFNKHVNQYKVPADNTETPKDAKLQAVKQFFK